MDQTKPNRIPQILFSLPVMLSFVPVAMIFLMVRTESVDPDIWWHLRNAQVLFQTGRFIRSDLYSFTVPGHPWISHEWLAEIPYYLAWRAGDLAGIRILEIALLSAIFLALLLLCYEASGNIKASVLAVGASIYLATVSFGPRTILFGYLYLVVLLLLLQRYRRRGRAALWAIPLLFCLWVNTHGSWSIGVIVFAISVAAGCIRGAWGRVDGDAWTPQQFHALLITGAASAAALFVNPFGARLVFYPLDLAFRQKLNVSYIAEWVSVDFHGARGKLLMGLLLFMLVSALLRDCRWVVTELALLSFGLYCGLTYSRFLFLLAIVAAPVVARLLDFVPAYDPKKDRYVLNAAVIVLMLAAMVRNLPRTADIQRNIARRFPAGAVAYLNAHPPPDHMLNEFLWGGYLEWYAQDVKVFIDSRVDIFEYAGVFRDYLDVLDLQQPRAVLEKYQIGAALLPPALPLTYVLEHDPAWKVVYRDPACVLLEKAEDSTGAPAGGL